MCLGLLGKQKAPAQTRGHAIQDRLAHASNRHQVQGLLNGPPVAF